MSSRKVWFDAFSRSYYKSNVYLETHWMGYQVVKCPLDLWAYAEIIWETTPDLIVETGAYIGGSALYLAHALDAVGDGEIVSIDLRPLEEMDVEFPEHDRIEFLPGVSSTDPVALSHVKQKAQGKRVMVILDSDHTKAHVLRELNLYSPLVAKGCYLIVEDTNPWSYMALGHSECGPAEALKEWQPVNRGFEVDRHRERWVLTQNPGGYLRRVR